MNRYEWIQFFIFYYVACAIEVIEKSNHDLKKKMLSSLEIVSSIINSDQTAS